MVILGGNGQDMWVYERRKVVALRHHPGVRFEVMRDKRSDSLSPNTCPWPSDQGPQIGGR